MALVLSNSAPGSGMFRQTRWTLVRRIRDKDRVKQSDIALNELCSLYWEPVYRYIRMLGQSKEDAEDLTQQFFLRSLKNELFEKSDRSRGKLRTLICVAVNRFVIDEGRRQRRFKRGGHLHRLPCDVTEIESRLRDQGGSALSPDHAFDIQCGRAILDEVWDRLEKVYIDAGDQDLFAMLSPFIVGPEGEAVTQVAAAEELGITPDAFWKRLKRLRLRYRVILTNRIAQTVESQDDIEGELRHLRRVFASHSH